MFHDLFHRLQTARLWLLLEFLGLPLLVLVGIGWTRLGEKLLWQVALSLLLPALLLAALLALQAATLRRLLAPLAESHTSFLQATIMLLPALVFALLAGHLLDLCDGRIFMWASLLNSKAPAAWRARLLTFEHLSLWMNRIEWLLRWVALPWLLMPFAVTAVERGWRLDWRAALHVLLDWRWLLTVLLLALFCLALPSKLFDATPHGALSAQIWTVSIKLAVAYLSALVSWLLLLGWSVVLLRRKKSVAGKEIEAASEEASSA